MFELKKPTKESIKFNFEVLEAQDEIVFRIVKTMPTKAKNDTIIMLKGVVDSSVVITRMLSDIHDDCKFDENDKGELIVPTDIYVSSNGKTETYYADEIVDEQPTSKPQRRAGK